MDRAEVVALTASGEADDVGVIDEGMKEAMVASDDVSLSLYVQELFLCTRRRW